MRTIENFMNRLTDMDSGWWPFLHLRPATNQLIDNGVLVKMALHFGPFYGIVLSIIIAFPVMSELSLFAIAISGLVCVTLLTIFFFIVYKYSFALFWNRRARRLREHLSAPPAT